MDMPLLGDFPCEGSEVPGKCGFHLDINARSPTKGRRMCSLMGPQCKGFVYNSGVNLVILKNDVQGFPKYTVGFELHVKKVYVKLVNVTTEECATSVKVS
jgi:hypothetical protein